MIPDGWKIELLGEFMIVKDGVHQTPTYTESGIPFLRVTDIQDESINLSKTKYISKEEHEKITARLKPTNGDILYSKNGTIGITRIVDWDWEFSFFVSLALLRFKKDGYSTQYLAQYLQSGLAKREIYQGSKQGSVINLHLEEIQKFRVPIPPFSEQCKIAEILGVWDESIDLLEKLIGKTRSRKQGLMQQLLTGKKRFKEFEGSEWKEYQLSQIANITMGTSPKSESYNSNKEGLPLLQGNADIKNRVSAPRIWTTEITKECYPTDILISVRAPVGTIAISLHHACIGRGIASIKAKSKILPNYLYQLLLFFEPKWAKLSQGSTFDSVNSADIKSRIFSIPLMIPEQEKIAAVLSAADDEISTLEKQLAAYKQQKLGLIQQLLTGKIRVGMI